MDNVHQIGQLPDECSFVPSNAMDTSKATGMPGSDVEVTGQESRIKTPSSKETPQQSIVLDKLSSLFHESDFPMTRQQILGKAREAQAGSDVLTNLVQLPDMTYRSFSDFRQEFQEQIEQGSIV